MVIHPHIPKRKTKKPTAQQRALQANWQEILEKYDVKPNKIATIVKSNSSRVNRPGSDTRHIPSLDTGSGIAVKKPIQQYTGDAMIGIGQLHKSNAVPIFSKEDAIDIAKMRRG